MERGITIIPGIPAYTIQDLLPGGLGSIIIPGPAGVFQWASVMAGAAGDSIHTEELTGVLVDITMDTGMDIIMDTGGDMAMVTGRDMLLPSGTM